MDPELILNKEQMFDCPFKRNVPSTATIHFLSKQTAHGSKHAGANSFVLHPHSLSRKITTEAKGEEERY